MTQSYQRLSLLVYVRDPERIFYEGPAFSVSSTNASGPFDILPEHENFISLIKQNIVIHMITGEKREIPLEKGVLKTQSNKVWVFLGLEDVNKVAKS